MFKNNSDIVNGAFVGGNFQRMNPLLNSSFRWETTNEFFGADLVLPETPSHELQNSAFPLTQWNLSYFSLGLHRLATVCDCDFVTVIQ